MKLFIFIFFIPLILMGIFAVAKVYATMSLYKRQRIRKNSLKKSFDPYLDYTPILRTVNDEHAKRIHKAIDDGLLNCRLPEETKAEIDFIDLEYIGSPGG